MTRKRMISLGLSTALALSLSAPALAVAPDVTATETINSTTEGVYVSSGLDLTGTVKAPLIELAVPNAGGVVINPYSMKFDWTGGDFTSPVETATEDQSQIISPTQFIENKSDVSVSVKAKVTGSIPTGSEAKFATTAPTEKVTDKAVFMYFEMMTAAGNALANKPTWADAYSKADHLLVSTTPAEAIGTATAGTVTLDDKTGTNKFAAFHLAGSTATKPATPWTTDDGVDVNVVFTFTPIATEVAP